MNGGGCRFRGPHSAGFAARPDLPDGQRETGRESALNGARRASPARRADDALARWTAGRPAQSSPIEANHVA